MQTATETATDTETATQQTEQKKTVVTVAKNSEYSQCNKSQSAQTIKAESEYNMSKTRKTAETIENMTATAETIDTAQQTAEATETAQQTATAEAETTTAETADSTADKKADKKADSKKQKERTNKEIIEALENNEVVTLAEVAKMFRNRKFTIKEADNEHDNSLYIVKNEKVYLSFNFTRKKVTVFSRKESRQLEIFNAHVGANLNRKKADLTYKEFYSFIQTVTA